MCPSCAAPLSLKFSSKHRGMPFVGCSTYPDCDYSRPIAADWLADLGPGPDAAAAADSDAAAEAAAAAAQAALGGEAALEGAEGLDAETAEALRQMGMKGGQLPRSQSPPVHPAASRAAASCCGDQPLAPQGGGAAAFTRRPAPGPRPAGFARYLGRCPDTGLPVFVRSGLYGPYVQRGMEGKDGFKRQPLPRVGRGAAGRAGWLARGAGGLGSSFRQRPFWPARCARPGHEPPAAHAAFPTARICPTPLCLAAAQHQDHNL